MSNETDSKPGTAEQDEKPKLKVTDRRMFDTDGNPRQPDGDPSEAYRAAPSSPVPAAEEAEETSEAAPTPERAAPAVDPVPARAADDSAPTAAAADSVPTGAADESGSGLAEEDDSAPAGSYADLPRGFAPFVESQYLEALIFLGAVPHPQTGETMEDPEFARYKIDLLTMIQEKTEGNLSEEESRVMEDVLYQLRMLFVQKTGPAAS